ncbi:circularly permuted type 2 ATP-grasp protein [Frigidibacter oleivorans]|uniref:circularly permuted type 2 ATP-grasp protein n=1 Tax=Frigidibacter oleivorans TaxID=2487129 RepID=UPI000F8F410C|nr:circularly permuted type 2 ATP-grasp protein [Frigidibacter oleivorans]
MPPAGPPSDPVAALLGGYAPLPGVADELVDGRGRVRPGWQPLLQTLARPPGEGIAARIARGDQYLRDAGVFYRLYAESGSTERAWPLSHVPVVVHEAEWSQIARGLAQRADLLEQVVADLYGPGRLVAEGHLPPQLVAQNPEWLRAMVGVTPRSGHFLHMIAFEIGRSPDGSWFVLGDRTQAPSGAGFALENRMATSRVFPEAFAATNVPRLAGFFRAFRETLMAMRGAKARIGILTPGPMNDTYYEHTYIARYLGFMLLEGEDLVVQDGSVMVRTVAGPQPVDVLWRRLDARFADPLELDGQSRIGTPGLVSAVRAGRLDLVNALGAGIVETRAFLAFLPRICEVLTGQPLILPNIATWWCGQPAERDFVQEHLERMMIGPAQSYRLPFDAIDGTVAGDAADAGQRRALRARIAAEGPSLVGQEAVTLSTTPALVGGKLAPLPMSLRAFAVRTPEGWQVMPGGYARIGRSRDATAIAMQRGGSVADVWVASDAPVPADTMVPATTMVQRTEVGGLPSRAADNLFWLGRYVERAEDAVRLLRAWHLRLAESGTPDRPLLKALGQFLRLHGFDPQAGFAETLAARIEDARDCAGKVRDRFSTDGWVALSDLAVAARAMCGRDLAGDDAARALGAFLRQVSGFSGLVHDNMYRFAGWRFLTLGRALERANVMSWTLATFADIRAPEGALDLAVELGDSLMTHRRRYTIGTSRETVVDLLALDGGNPRSVFFQISEIRDQVARLPGGDRQPMGRLPRRVLELHTSLAVLSPPEVTTTRLSGLRSATDDLAGLIAETYFG